MFPFFTPWTEIPAIRCNMHNVEARHPILIPLYVLLFCGQTIVECSFNNWQLRYREYMVGAEF